MNKKTKLLLYKLAEEAKELRGASYAALHNGEEGAERLGRSFAKVWAILDCLEDHSFISLFSLELTSRPMIKELREEIGPPEKNMEPPEPVAWSFQLARSRNAETGEYTDWSGTRLSTYKPDVPEGSIRNLQPLYAGLKEN